MCTWSKKDCAAKTNVQTVISTNSCAVVFYLALLIFRACLLPGRTRSRARMIRRCEEISVAMMIVQRRQAFDDLIAIRDIRRCTPGLLPVGGLTVSRCSDAYFVGIEHELQRSAEYFGKD